MNERGRLVVRFFLFINRPNGLNGLNSPNGINPVGGRKRFLELFPSLSANLFVISIGVNRPNKPNPAVPLCFLSVKRAERLAGWTGVALDKLPSYSCSVERDD